MFMKTLHLRAGMLSLLCIIYTSKKIEAQVDKYPAFKVKKPSAVTKKPTSDKKEKNKEQPLLPHQKPDFYDDCTRYYYWYYVNYLDTFQHPVIQECIHNNGELKSYDCFLEPFRKWENKHRKNLYCNALVDDYLRILSGMEVLKTNINPYAAKPQMDENIYSDFTCFDSAGISISPELIRAGNVISYTREYLYYKIPNNQFRTFSIPSLLYSGHTAIIADILLHDVKNKIYILVMLNKPYDVYTLSLYDYKYNILIDDISFVKNYSATRYIMNKKFKFEYMDLNTEVFGWLLDPAPFIDCNFNTAIIIETMNVYELFKWYEKNNIPYQPIKKISKK